MTFTPITKSTRCGQHGRLIRCPHCRSVKRIYHLSWSAIHCRDCDRWVDRLDWSIGPNVSQKQLKPKSSWSVSFPGHTVYGPTKSEALRRAKSSIERAKQHGYEWSVIRESIPGWTVPPMVLVFDRNHEAAIQEFNELMLYRDQLLDGVDWCGNRVVYRFLEDGQQVDLPFDIYEELLSALKSWHIEPDLCMRREDPGLGIYLPEIDDDRMEALKRAKAEAAPSIS